MVLVSGKGGVGKTTVTAALATLAARAGLKVLLCELERDGRLARFFNNGASGLDESAARNISFLFVDPEAALEEYLKIYLRIKQVYRTIVQSPIMNYFLQAAPGFRELLIMGKIWWEVQLQEGRPRRHRWDLVLVDAPATGHGISFMGVAHSVADMVRVGPIHNQAKNMLSTLQDERSTVLVPVTLPEEMPVNETVDLVSRVGEGLGIAIGPLVVNGMPTQVFPMNELATWREMEDGVTEGEPTSPQLSALVKLARMGRNRREAGLQYRRQLRERLRGIEIVDVPYLRSWKWDSQTVIEVAGYLQRSLDL